jgi:hypothetical protein
VKALGAALGGSALAALISTILLTLFNIVAYQGRSGDFMAAMIGFLPLVFFATAIAASTLGLAWHALARSQGWSSVHSYWPAAVAAGIAPVFFLMLGPMIEDGARAPLDRRWFISFFIALALGASLGGLTAIFAWLIRRPDRDAPNPPRSAP